MIWLTFPFQIRLQQTCLRHGGHQRSERRSDGPTASRDRPQLFPVDPSVHGRKHDDERVRVLLKDF